MPAASEIEPVSPGIFIWRFYDSAVKADLFSTALKTALGLFLIDPIPLTPDAIARLRASGKVAGIVVTNKNHQRAAAGFAQEFQVAVYLHATLVGTIQLPIVTSLQDNVVFSPGLTAVEIDGGPAGEIAVHSDAGGGTLIIGDALINFDPYGFALLPAKYCSNFKEMRRSLSKLLDYSFERMLFAHGLPILSCARQRLELLLQERR